VKSRKIFLTATIACVMSLALPALAAGDGDQKGPACTDIRLVQFQLTEQIIAGTGLENTEPDEIPDDIEDPDGDGWIVRPSTTGTWDGGLFVRLPNAPCVTKAGYRVDLLLTGTNSSGASVTDARPMTIPAAAFTQAGAAEEPYWEWSYRFTIDEGSQYEPTGACNKVESTWQKHVADASPDKGTAGTDSAGRICGFETESGGARSFGARSFG
jgi:hypothetical protein